MSEWWLSQTNIKWAKDCTLVETKTDCRKAIIVANFNGERKVTWGIRMITSIRNSTSDRSLMKERRRDAKRKRKTLKIKDKQCSHQDPTLLLKFSH